MTTTPIVSTKGVVGGKPRIQGTRISVEFLLELLESGMSTSDIQKEYPHISETDIRAALTYAKGSVQKEHIVTLPGLSALPISSPA